MVHVNIYGNNFSYEDKEFLHKIFGFIDVTKGMIKFIDMDTMQPDPNSLINICIDNTHTIFSRALISAGKFSAKDLLSGNIVNDDMKFIMFTIPMSVNEIQATEANKGFTWQKLLQLKEYLYKYGYLTAEGNSDEEAVAETESVAQAEDPIPDVKEDTAPARSINTTEEGTVTVNVEEVLNRIVDELKATDPAMGKSLKLTSRVSLETEDGGILNIYPSNIIKAENEGAHISFRDMLAIVKMSLIVGSKTIKFHQGE